MYYRDVMLEIRKIVRHIVEWRSKGDFNVGRRLQNAFFIGINNT